MTFHSFRASHDFINNHVYKSETLYAYIEDDSIEPDSYPFLNLDIPGIKEEILFGDSMPNTTLIVDDEYRSKIWAVRALSIPNEVILEIENAIKSMDELPEEVKHCPVDIRVDGELCAHYDPGPFIARLHCESLIKSIADKSTEKDQYGLAHYFGSILQNGIVKMELADSLDLFNNENIRLTELAVFVRDLSLLIFLLDNGGDLNIQDWKIASFFSRDTVVCPDKNIAILEVMVSRGLSLEELLSEGDLSIENVYQKAEISGDQKLISFLDKHGYAHLSHKATDEVTKIAGLQKV